MGRIEDRVVRKRIQNLGKAAQKGGQIERDEPIEEAALAEEAGPYDPKEADWVTNTFKRTYALVATDRAFYAWRLTDGMGWKVKETLIELPLDEVTLHRNGRMMTISDPDGVPLWRFAEIPKFGRFGELAQHVEQWQG